MRSGDDDDSWRSILNEALSEEHVPSESDVKPPHSLLAAGIGTALAINLGILAFSLPPVLRGRGAPYLPTWERNLDVMFQEHLRGVDVTRLTFVDLGSGDGRVVRRAAREGFGLSIGYEINPLLHLWAKTRQSPRTELHCANLWDVSLGKVDVVAVVSSEGETHRCFPGAHDISLRSMDSVPS